MKKLLFLVLLSLVLPGQSFAYKGNEISIMAVDNHAPLSRNLYLTTVLIDDLSMGNPKSVRLTTPKTPLMAIYNLVVTSTNKVKITIYEDAIITTPGTPCENRNRSIRTPLNLSNLAVCEGSEGTGVIILNAIADDGDAFIFNTLYKLKPETEYLIKFDPIIDNPDVCIFLETIEY